MIEFLKHWFAALVVGLEEVDETAREAILSACGRACAHSYTAEMFCRVRAQSASMDEFLAALGKVFPEAAYELIAPGKIRVRYGFCACDLVKLGLLTSPLLCRCSVHNLRENFERALHGPVEVTLEASILEGAPQCAFLVRLT